jgi:hypothetical protein
VVAVMVLVAPAVVVVVEAPGAAVAVVVVVVVVSAPGAVVVVVVEVPAQSAARCCFFFHVFTLNKYNFPIQGPPKAVDGVRRKLNCIEIKDSPALLCRVAGLSLRLN